MGFWKKPNSFAQFFSGKSQNSSILLQRKKKRFLGWRLLLLLVAQSCVTLCNPMDCSFPVLHRRMEVGGDLSCPLTKKSRIASGTAGSGGCHLSSSPILTLPLIMPPARWRHLPAGRRESPSSPLYSKVLVGRIFLSHKSA